MKKHHALSEVNQSTDSLPVVNANLSQGIDQDEIDLRALFRIMVRFRRLIASIFFVVLLTSLIITLLLRPMYSSSVSLEVNTTGRSIVKFQNVESQDLGTREYIQTQSKILNSDVVAKEVIEKLELIKNPEFNGKSSQRGLVVCSFDT